MLDSIQEKVSEGLEKAVDSVKNERAEEYKKNGSPTKYDIDSLISNYSNTNAVISGGASLIPGPWGMAAAVPEIITVTRNQMAMIHDIGTAHNQNKEIPKEIIIGVMLGASGSAATGLMVVQGQKIMAKRVGARALQQVIKVLGGKITQQAAKSMAAKWLPLAGAVAMAAWSRYSTQQIGEKAKELLKYEIVPESEEIIVNDVIPPVENPQSNVAVNLTKLKIESLINLLKIDGVIDSNEIAFVTEFINNTDLSMDDKADLLTKIESKEKINIDYTPFLNDKEEALYLLIDLIALAKVDGKFDLREQMFIKILGEKCNFSADEIKNLMEE